MPEEYLSTDPNAGEPVEEYLSTDPNAGTVTGRKMGWMEALGQGAMNLPGGLASNVGQIAQMAAGGAKMLVNPAHAAEVLTGAFQAGQKQGLGGVVGDIGRDYKQAYGGLENIKQTLANDPVRLLMDASMGLTGVGGVATKAGLGTAGRMATAAGRAIDPAMGAYKVASGVARKVGPTVAGMQNQAGRLWESGVKPAQSLVNKNQGINFGLEGAKRGFVASEEGMAKANALRESQANTARKMRDTATKQSAVVRPKEVVSEFDQRAGLIPGKEARAASFMDAAQGAKKDFLGPRQAQRLVTITQPTGGTIPSVPVTVTKPITVNQAESMTSRLGKRVNFAKRNPLTTSSQATSAEAEANEILYSSLKDVKNREIDAGVKASGMAAPSYANLQKDRGTNIALSKAMQQAVRREQNRNMLSGRSLLGTAIGGIGAGALLGPQAGALGGLGTLGTIALLSHLDNPAVKTRMANRLYKFAAGQPGRQQMYRQAAGAITPGSLLARLMSSHEQEP